MKSKSTSDPLEYLRYGSARRFFHKFYLFLRSIPRGILDLLLAIWGTFKGLALYFVREIRDVIATYKNGNKITRASFFVMGFSSLARGQILRGILFLLFQIIFVFYTAVWGWRWIAKLSFRGLEATKTVPGNPIIIGGVEYTENVTVYGDNNLQIMIYGVLSLLFVFCFLYTWRVNVRQSKLSQELLAQGKPLKRAKDDLHAALDSQFHKTVLALPTLGILFFTVIPIIIMVMVAFTNYDASHTPPQNLFHWVGLDNFNQIFTWQGGSKAFSATFGEILTWTLIWAFFATFTNYFLGMLVAMMINKKGIKLKKLWRTILVLTIAVPQFISLLYVSKLFADEGLVNRFLIDMGWIDRAIPFWTDATLARVMVILVNVWVGIPYQMLITTGVLMNIPSDLYESARIDGAKPYQQYIKITLPYMLFVTGPYLLTNFIGNMNNFNVIYLLTGGAPYTQSFAGAGKTDLLITWLYRLTVTNNDYKLAAVIGIMVFLVVAVISLVVYNYMPSIKSEEEFQ